MLTYLLVFLALLDFSGEKSLKIDGKKARLELVLGGDVKITPVWSKTLRVSYTLPDRLAKYFLIEQRNDTVRIGFTDSLKVRTFNQLKEIKDTLKFEIELPMLVLLDLEIISGLSYSEIELGGLKLTNFSFGLGAGEAHIKFSKPNRTTMDKFEIGTGASKVKIYKLGNANFTKGEIDCGAASLSIDIGGKWKEEAALYINSGLASINLKAPRTLPFNIIKEGIVNPGLSEVKVKNPKLTIYFTGAFNLINYEFYE